MTLGRLLANLRYGMPGVCFEGDGGAGGGGGTPPAPWHQGLAPEVLTHVTNLGWKDKTPAEVAALASTSHLQAQRYIGAPADKLLRIPDANDANGQAAFWSKLGAGDKAEAYDFSKVVGPDGKPFFSEKTLQALQTTAAQNHVPVTMAQAVAKAIADQAALDRAETMRVNTGRVEAEKTALKQEWGGAFDSNLIMIKNAVKTLGWDPTIVDALEANSSYGVTMKALLRLGQGMGEDGFVDPQGGGGGGGALTKEQAAVRKAELQEDLRNDPAKNASYLKKGPEYKEMMKLNQIITGETF